MSYLPVNLTIILDVFNFLVQESLCVLKIDHNNIDEIKDLTVLKELRQFSAPDNKLHSMEVRIVFFVCLFVQLSFKTAVSI